MDLLKTYACYDKDNNIRLNSSSGGVFYNLAKHVIANGGLVYGVVMEENCYSAKFDYTSNMKDIFKFMGSKYLQADMGDIFLHVKEMLLNGKIVLFTGTNCQISGLKKFLGKEYENLILVDVICHGVPSKKLWKKILTEYENSNHEKASKISFRSKEENWTNFGMKINNDFIPKNKSTYMTMFLRDYCLRPSCYDCKSKNEKESDITIGDFWGINNINSNLNDERGCSLVIVRTEKGNKVFKKISDDLMVEEVSYKEAVKYNIAEFQSVAMPPQRIAFYGDLDNLEYSEFVKKYTKPLKKNKIYKIKRKIKLIIKKLFDWR